MQRLQLLIKDSDDRIHRPIVEVGIETASFLKLAAINGMMIVGAIEELPTTGN